MDSINRNVVLGHHVIHHGIGPALAEGCVIVGRPDLIGESFHGYYKSLLDAYSCDVLLKRPDYYVFGGARSVEEMSGLFKTLRARLA